MKEIHQILYNKLFHVMIANVYVPPDDTTEFSFAFNYALSNFRVTNKRTSIFYKDISSLC